MTTVTELIEANPNEDARYIACKAMGTCRDCGAAYKWSGDEVSPDEWIRNALQMETECPHIAETCLNVKWICDDCAGKIERQASARNMSNAASSARCKSVTTFSAFGDTFEKSKVMIERRNAEQWAKAREWKQDCCAWIDGPKGTGKTFLGRCLLNAAISRGITAGELCAVDLASKCHLYDWERDSARYSACGVLLIDDVDKGDWDARAVTELWRIMNARYESKSPTVFTANMTVKRFGELMLAKHAENGNTVETIFDRMRISHEFLSIRLNGTSLRKERADYNDSE